MALPNFTAAESLAPSRGHYRSRARGGAPSTAVVPAIPFCGNCDEILDRCAQTGGRPRALCHASAVGNCFSGVEDPTPWDPWSPNPRYRSSWISWA